MKIKRIVFIRPEPFTDRDTDRYGVESLLKRGFEVQWQPHTKALTPSDFALPLVSLSLLSIHHYHALSLTPAPYAFLLSNALPLPFLLAVRRVGYRFLMHQFCRYYSMRPADFVFCGGIKSAENQYLITGSDTQFKFIHTFDYDIYMEYKKHYGKSPNKTAVFLDENNPNHPDFATMPPHKRFPVECELYYAQLRNFFDILEQDTGLKVVVAAHPSADLDNYALYFRGRKVIKGDTCNLIANASLVLAHASTSINFACLFRKPMIFMTNKTIKKHAYGSYINTTAKQFGIRPIDITDAHVPFKIPKIKPVKYSEYEESWIKPFFTPDVPFWDQVGEMIERRYK